mmetsp:Transcript_1015/g.1839  ORF Transcript_1015/g.1839 Transcript_1015/m.1839 type:complete len:220 (+) Transcript_1015:108-767(+)
MNLERIDVTKLKVNVCFLVVLAIVMGLSSLNLGLALSANQVAFSILQYELGLEESKDAYQTALQTCSVGGLALGSLFGGSISKNGRRPVIIKYNLAIIVACLISIVPSIYVICIGRFLHGFAAGVLVSATPKMIDETVPTHIIDNGFGVSTNIIINFAIFGMLFLGEGAPDTIEEKMISKYWVLCYLVPVPLVLIALFHNVMVHKFDSLTFLIEKKDRA